MSMRKEIQYCQCKSMLTEWEKGNGRERKGVGTRLELGWVGLDDGHIDVIYQISLTHSSSVPKRPMGSE